MSTAKTLTVVQLLVLSTAAQREDHMVLPLPPTIRARGRAQRNLLAALVKMDLVEEVPADDASIAWRTDEAGQSLGLRLTAAGLTATGAAETPPPKATARGDEQPQASAPSEPTEVERASTEQIAEETPCRRPNGKLGEVLQAISAEAGATLTEITTLTGWLPHTARSAVTGLRQRGFPIQLVQQKGRKAYRITATG